MKFSQAQMFALCAAEDGSSDTSWIRANTIRSLAAAGFIWKQRGRWNLTSAGSAAFAAAGGYDATWKDPNRGTRRVRQHA